MPSSSATTPPVDLDFSSLPPGVFVNSPVARVVQEDPDTSERGIDGLIGASTHCSFVYRVDQVGDGEVTRTWVPCKRWVCRYCREQKIDSEARRFAAAFDGDGRTVHRDYFDTREQATNAVRYATKLGHAALVIPMVGGSAVLFTTHPRRGALALGAGDVAEQLPMFLSQVPGYTKDFGEHRVVNPNRVLAEHLLGPQEFRRKEVHDARAEYMEPGRLAAVERAEARRVRYYGTEEFDDWVERLGLVLTRSQYGHIMSYRIPDGRTESAKAFLFWSEFSRLSEVRVSFAD